MKMNKRPLFVFAGQSNMMGAAVYPASEQIYFNNSYEYLHKPRRMGANAGIFKNYGFPSGEFSYRDLQAAYGEITPATYEIKSDLADYAANTLFVSSLCNLKDEEQKETEPFAVYSEKTMNMGVCLPPFWVQELEKVGYSCAYAHIAKGAVAIKYYLEGIAADYFEEKSKDFFEDCQNRFAGDDMSVKALVWLQGEDDARGGYEEYKKSLSRLWDKARKIGFTHFLCVRIDYFGNPGIVDVMQAQEDFCKETENAFIITRSCSFMRFVGQDDKEWFLEEVPLEYHNCRDSFYGFPNQHINEKGFRLIAKRSADNFIKIMNGEEPDLEPELLKNMKNI